MCFLSFFVQAKGKVFVFCLEGSPSYFNPQIATDGTSLSAIRDIYDGLLRLDRINSSIKPALATSWNISKDRLEYTFHLRKRVSFHTTPFFKPTREFNAEDVVFSFSRVFDKKNPYHQASGGNYQYFESMGLMDLVKKISKIDSHTVRFYLKEKSSIFLVSIAMQFSAILSKEYADQILKNKKSINTLDNKPIGTGPFSFSSYVKDSIIRYKTNNKYFRGPSSLDGMVFAITPDPSVRFQKLKRGECHLISFPSPADLNAISKHKKLKLIKREVYDLAYLGMNVEKKPLNNVKVRKAIRYALNRSFYIKAIYLNHAKKAKGAMPSTMWGYNNKIKDYDYNVEKSKSLLKEAGYSKGFNIELWTLPVSRPYNPSGKKMGELMQADLEKVGIKVKLVTFDWTTYLKKVGKGEHALVQLGWTSDNGDPDNFLGTLLGCNGIKSGTNVTRWCDSNYDKLIHQATKILSKKKRSQLYKKAQVIFADQSPWAPLVHSFGYRGAVKEVQGYILPAFGAESFYGVSLKE